jgi:pilus assembly protein TadC
MEKLKILFNDLIFAVVGFILFITTILGISFFFSFLTFYVGLFWATVLSIVLCFAFGFTLCTIFDYSKI